MTDDEAFERRLTAELARVDCPFCGADMLDNRCESCGHDPSTRAKHL